MNTFNTTNNHTKTRAALLLLAAGSAALLAGCGGGGGNGNTVGTTGTTGTGTTGTTGTGTGGSSTSQVVGKVTDTFGRGIPGVSIAVDTGGQIATTISTGGYRLDNLTAAVHKITAAVTLGSVQYTGSTQVATTADTSGGYLNSNVNILLSPVNQQATVQGYVRDASGNAIVGASVYAAVPTPAIAANGSAGNYSSLVAFTDSTGFYQIANIPSSLPPGSLSVTASSPTTSNGSVSISQNSVTPNSVLTQNFTLTPSTNAVADTPVIVGINSFTQPTDGLVGAALQARLVSGSGSVYEGLRRRLSPSYAAFAARKRTVGKRLLSRASGSAYAVEVDLGFNPPAATDINLLGYNIYRTTGSVVTNPPIEAISGAKADFYDSLIDPQANYYTDLTASTDALGSPYAGDTQYNFALSSIASSTINASNQSAISNVYSITPLSPLTLTAPTANQTVAGSVTISWTPVTGATNYYMFLYSQYPSIGTIPLNGVTGTAFPAGTSSASVTLAGGSATYYVIVAAGKDETETAASATNAAPTATVNAAQSYSAITPFIVQ